MKIRIEHTKKEQKPKREKNIKSKQRKLKVMKVGKHKKSVLALWSLLILSISFSVYKNFTAIDQHTTHEKIIVKETLMDTSGIQSYVTRFANVYFTWRNKRDALKERTEKINSYLTEDLQHLNIELVRADIPTSSEVAGVQIVEVTKKDDTSYHVVFTIQQKITEGKKSSSTHSTYEVTVHQDLNGDKVITQNPTMTANTEKSDYKPKQVKKSDGSIDSDTTEEITTFLETFFKLYPKATKEELAYYTKEDVLAVLDKNLVFSKIHSLVLNASNSSNVVATVSVEYLDRDTKTTQIFQYKLVLEKQKNWVISVVK